MRKILKYSLVGAIILIQSLMFEVGADKLAKLRTTKKIVPVEEISAPYFAVQILALKKAPQDPSYFKNIERAKEYECADGYVRYTVGAFSSAAEARTHISKVKAAGYSECFVVDIRNYNLYGNEGGTSVKTDANTVYTVQLAAYRYPVYVSEFEGVDDVDFQLYDRFFADADQKRFSLIREAEPKEKLSLHLDFEDTRIPTMLFRHVARNWEEVLTEEQLLRWRSFCAERTLNPPGAVKMNWNFFKRKIEERLASTETPAQEKLVLADLKQYGEELEKRIFF